MHYTSLISSWKNYSQHCQLPYKVSMIEAKENWKWKTIIIVNSLKMHQFISLTRHIILIDMPYMNVISFAFDYRKKNSEKNNYYLVNWRRLFNMQVFFFLITIPIEIENSFGKPHVECHFWKTSRDTYNKLLLELKWNNWIVNWNSIPDTCVCMDCSL